MRSVNQKRLRFALLASLFILGGIIIGYILCLFVIWSPEEQRAKKNQPVTFTYFLQQYAKALGIIIAIWTIVFLLNFNAYLI